jgi:hypothetical protein
MAAPPANFGGERNFIADPQNAGVSEATGDLTALSLQLIHALTEGNVIPDAQRPLVLTIAGRFRQVLAASEASQAREKSTREMRPVTQIPDVQYGAIVNTTNIRMNNIVALTGLETDPYAVTRWLSRILNLARSHTLTFPATINLMIQGSTSGAADYIEQMREEGKPLAQIVQHLEMRYGDLCSPEEARVKCNALTRKDKEGLSEFIDRLRNIGKMACRMEENGIARQQAVDLLVEGNIRRVLPNSVRNLLEERVINRKRSGLPGFTARELEKECLDLERRRSERREIAAEPAGMRRQARVQQVLEIDSDSEQDDDSTEEEEEIDENMTLLIQAIQQQNKIEAGKGKPVDPKKVYRRAFRNYQQKFPRGKPPRNAKQGAAAMVGVGPAQVPGYPRIPGPPNRLDGPRKTILELLALANCVKGQCIQCGNEGHMMRSDQCALKDLPLMDRPCTKCGYGLHAGDSCPRVFQQKYQVTPSPNNANFVQSEPLNEN